MRSQGHTHIQRLTYIQHQHKHTFYIIEKKPKSWRVALQRMSIEFMSFATNNSKPTAFAFEWNSLFLSAQNFGLRHNNLQKTIQKYGLAVVDVVVVATVVVVVAVDCSWTKYFAPLSQSNFWKLYCTFKKFLPKNNWLEISLAIKKHHKRK